MAPSWQGATLHPAAIETYDDHRMAMSFALVATRMAGIRTNDPGCVAKTYPDYFQDLDRLHRGSEGELC